MVIVQEQPLANTSGEDDPYSAGTESNDDDNDSGDEDNCNDYDDEDSGDEDEYDEEDKENDSGNDDEENDDEDESEDNAGQEEREDARNIGALIRDEISELVDLVEKASKEFIQRIPVVIQELPVINNIIARGAIEQDMDSVDEESEHEFFEHFPLSLKRRNRVTSASQIDIMTSETNGDDDDDDGDDNDNDYQDEDEYDQFPSNMQHNNDRKRNGGNNSVGGNKNIASKAFPKNKHPGQNTNLGSTGGNGPILLCSSRSCLPSLRDAILSRISVQIHHVMNHLRNQEILTRLMDSTAPQTKMSLMAAQEELVQQLEEYVIKDLRDWVMGIRRNSTVAFRKGNQSKKISKDVSATPEDPSAVSLSTLSLADALDLTDVTVESAGLYLGGDEDDSGNGNQHDFWMANLDLGEDEDDDDEDHEDDDYEGHGDEPSNKINPIMKNKGANKDKKKPSTSSKKHRRTSSSSHLEKRAVSQESPQRLQQGQQQQKQRQQLGSADQYFLSADKLVMQHEWSHWIAHWTHRTKILILSHTLATKTLRDMNQIAVSGENVVRVDQRHWSWNLDKALATVMVASEMLCGGPSSPPSTASLSAKGAITPQAMAKTMSAQRCIDAWRGDLEEILQRTATVA
ncbi:hypothetical protein BG011_006450 [Mortierella polycephala]|uniref:Uncharacterized protein n=1 Tax=Mortierella polycephala TaxID=41804 RepID=A0A9P6PUH9_9FUNG|nr:hypothetical protein BG011_006450 [Mortierella polycephala]